MNDDIVDLLKQHGPCLTSSLIGQLEARGVTNAAARQRITRARSRYTRLAGLRFAKNARFIYLEDQFGDKRFWSALEDAFRSSGQAYWKSLAGLKARAGVCPVSMFPSVCGAPLARDRQLSPTRVIERLSAINLLETIMDDVSGRSFVQFKPHHLPKASLQSVNAVLLAERVALHGLRDWARRIGFGSYGRFTIRGDETPAVVSGVAWDLTAPSYMRPLVTAREGKLKPGFFVCDINLNGIIDEDAVAVFVSKHDMASAPVNVAPIFPMLIADVYTDTAFSRARQAGIVATTVAHLFGEETAKALRDLIGLLTDTGATAAVNPEHILRVMNALTKIEGAANNIRGSLFELVVGNLVKDIEGGYLSAGERKRDYETGRSAEIDVELIVPDDRPVLLIECKSKIPGAVVTIDQVQHWYHDRVPLITKILSNESRYLDRSFRFEIWSNGPFSDDALQWLENQQLEFDRHSVGWRDGKSMKKYAQKAKSASVRKILNEHYFLHPLAKRSRQAATS